MLVSAITVLLFAVGILGLMLYPKTEGKMNGIKIMVMGTMAILCYMAFCAAVCNVVGIFVGLPSTCVSLGILDVLLVAGIIRKKKVQKLFWRMSDIVSLVLVTAFVLWITLHIFTPQLALQYQNVDAAVHFSAAVDLMKRGSWDSLIYFSAYIDAMFIALFEPMLTQALYFKAFIIADIFMHQLEMWVFYYLVLTISDKKLMRIAAPILSVGYFFGYPAYSYMEGNFVYWSNGVVIFMLMLYALILIERDRSLWRYSIPLLLVGTYGNLCCNKLYVPINTLALVAVVFMILLDRQKKQVYKKRMIQVAVGGCALVGVAGITCMILWEERLREMLSSLIVPGGIYSALYGDVIFFLPALFYVCYYVFGKKKESKVVGTVSVCMLLVTVGMYILWYNRWMSNYYYYKIYYNLWLCGWLLIATALVIMAERKKMAGFFAYAGMVVLMCYLTLSDYDGKLAEVHEDYNGEYATTQFCSIYRYNRNLMLSDYEEDRISELTLDVFHYAIDTMAGTDVEMVTSDIRVQRWYQGSAWSHEKGEKYNELELAELLEFLDQTGVQAIIVERDDEKYLENQGYFDHCIQVYGNEDAAILMPFGERWLAVPEDVQAVSGQKMELYTYALDQYAEEFVPLMATKDAYYDYVMYYIQSGNEMTDFYPWVQEEYENVLKNIDNLKEHEVEHFILLKEDAFYLEVQPYLTEESIVYENEAGVVIAVQEMEVE